MTIDNDEQFDIFSDNNVKTTDNDIIELTHWQPVAKDVEFEKHIAKLKAVQEFNRRSAR